MKKSLSQKITIRVSESDLFMLDIISSDLGLDRSNCIRLLINKRYKDITNSKEESKKILNTLKAKWVK